MSDGMSAIDTFGKHSSTCFTTQADHRFIIAPPGTGVRPTIRARTCASADTWTDKAARQRYPAASRSHQRTKRGTCGIALPMLVTAQLPGTTVLAGSAAHVA